MAASLTLERVQGIALITIDAQGAGVNVLSSPLMQELDELIAKVEAQNDLTAVVLASAKTSGFVAGADITEIEGVSDPTVGAELARNGQRIFSRLAGLPVP